MKCIKRIPVALVMLVLSKTVGAQISQTKAGLDLQAHRGGRGLMPENTIPAMKKAIDLGVTTLEMDVAITKDKKVVVSHDLYFNEIITTTPDGKAISKKSAADYLLFNMPYDSIRKYDVGLRPHPDFPRQQKVKAYKPLLAELINSVVPYAKSKGVDIGYNMEIKSKQTFDGTRHPDPATFAELLIQVLKEKKILDKTTIQSFDIRPLQYLHQKYPSIKLSYLVEKSTETLQDQLNRLGFVPSIYSPQYLSVTREVVEQSHKKGMKVIPWTVNSVEEMNDLIGMGVDGMISDYPDLYTGIKLAR